MADDLINHTYVMELPQKVQNNEFGKLLNGLMSTSKCSEDGMPGEGTDVLCPAPSYVSLPGGCPFIVN